MCSIRSTWTFGKHFLFSLGAALAAELIVNLATLRQAASFGIIGAADGPTSIFISHRSCLGLLGLILPHLGYILLFLLLLVLYRPLNHLIQK